jgi:DNA topoisomerase-1
MKLVIVETPSQAKTLIDVLGEGWRVEPCYGLVRDLPADQLGVEIENDFRPTFTVVPGKGNLIRRLMKAIRDSEAVYAATAPNREGESLAWHLLALSPDVKDKLVYRVTLTALTPDAIRAAFASPHPLDMKLIEAHITNRIIERLIGWSVSAAARKAVDAKVSLSYAGMVALQLLVQQETVISTFVSHSAWSASVVFEREGTRFTGNVFDVKGVPLIVRSKNQAHQLETLLQQGVYCMDKRGQTMQTLPPTGALTLVDLIEIAHDDLALTPERVLSLVETLYEAGWITHSDANFPVELSDAAQAYIRREYGTTYLNANALIKGGIAPTDASRIPEALPGDGAAVYALIWKYFIAAHMTAAQIRLLGTRILVGATQGKPYPLEVRTVVSLPYFDGWRRVLPISTADAALPAFQDGETFQGAEIVIEPVTCAPPAPYTAMSLARSLAACGFSTPSAVSAVDALIIAGYLTNHGGLAVTDSGRRLSTYLTETFNELAYPLKVGELHADIIRIESGKETRRDVLRTFWLRFGDTLCPTPAVRTAAEHKPIVLRPAEEV